MNNYLLASHNIYEVIFVPTMFRIITNTDSNEDFGNKDINFEYSNDNVNQIDNLLVSKESKNDINKINKNLEQMTKPQKIKEDIENLDEEILEIQSKLKEMLQK